MRDDVMTYFLFINGKFLRFTNSDYLPCIMHHGYASLTFPLVSGALVSNPDSLDICRFCSFYIMLVFIWHFNISYHTLGLDFIVPKQA
jgi:hypothetical protein